MTFAGSRIAPAVPYPSKSASKLVLVGGGAGFLGSHLCEHLLRDGHEVVCVDNFQTGRRENLDFADGSPRLSILEHDIAEPVNLAIDEIFNMACPASPPHYQADPVGTFRTSVWGTYNLLELSCRYKAKLLQASTSEVYGDPEVTPQPETYWGNVNPIGPRACYDEGKRGAETLCMDFVRTRGARVRIARIFNTFGPRMRPDDGRVVSNFIVQALQGRDLTVYGDGGQTRSLCYVDDLVRGLLRLMAASDSLHQPVNLGTPYEVTMVELAGMIRDLTGSKSRLCHAPLPVDDPRQRRPDLTRAEQELGYRPEVSLRDGLERTIAYFDTLLSKAKSRAAKKRAAVARPVPSDAGEPSPVAARPRARRKSVSVA